MTRIRFEDLPSKNTPINADSLNKLNNVIISPTEPTTGEEVWIKKGKNLYDKKRAFISGTFNQNIMVRMNVLPNTTYTFSIGSYTWGNVKEFDSSGVLLNSYGESEEIKTITFTTNSNVSYIEAQFFSGINYTSLDTIDFTQIQLEQGSTATFYEPYIDKKIYTKNDSGTYDEFSKGEEDTGWVTLELLNGCTNIEWNPLKARRKNGIVTIMGMVNVPSASWDKQIAVIPERLKPCTEINAVCRSVSGIDRAYIVAFNNDGRLSFLENINKDVSITDADISISIFITYIAD